jgi:hypothetical protein
MFDIAPQQQQFLGLLPASAAEPSAVRREEIRHRAELDGRAQEPRQVMLPIHLGKAEDRARPAPRHQRLGFTVRKSAV